MRVNVARDEGAVVTFLALVREQAAWNRQHLAQNRVRAFLSAWLDTRACTDLGLILDARAISRQAALNAVHYVQGRDHKEQR